MIENRARQDRHRERLIRPLRVATIRLVIAAPTLILAAGCGVLQTVGDFPNPKDTVTVYTTAPPHPAAGVAAIVP